MITKEMLAIQKAADFMFGIDRTGGKARPHHPQTEYALTEFAWPAHKTTARIKKAHQSFDDPKINFRSGLTRRNTYGTNIMLGLQVLEVFVSTGSCQQIQHFDMTG